MAKHLCPNVTSNQRDYSAPGPMVGLYVAAAATLVCFLLMICDVINGIHRRKRWVPCQFFSLNSVTLILLFIAAKPPMDLTTSLPSSAYDQLSKLTGTALICISMDFLMPSIGTNRASDCLTNMVALTILVFIVIMDICIQILTGVIFSFVREHAIVMFFMLTMLIILWISNWITNMQKEIQMDHNRNVFTNGRGCASMLQRLKLCYLYGYDSDPQFVLCKSFFSVFASIVCFFCLVVVLQVMFRSIFGHGLMVCNGVPGYRWSIWILIATQIFVILLASLTTSFRGLIMTRHLDDKKLQMSQDEVNGIKDNSPFLKRDTFMFPAMCVLAIAALVQAITALAVVLINFFADSISVLTSCWHAESEGIGEYRETLRVNGMVFEDWTLRKCVKDVTRWMSAFKNHNSLSHLNNLLSQTPPSANGSLEQLYSHYNFNEGNEVSCLYLVFLLRIASVSMPSSRSGHLVESFGEIFDVIFFVDAKINSTSFNGSKKRRLAKAMWMGQDFSILLPEIHNGTMNEQNQSEFSLDQALLTIRQLRNALPSCFMWDEVSIVMNFINSREYTSIEDLYHHMEQLFVDMLYIFLVQLPEAIFKEVTESLVEEYAEKVRLMLKIICQVESLEGIVQWSFPVGSNITHLIPPQASVVNHHNGVTIGNTDADSVASPRIVGGEQNVVDNAQVNEV